jgi:hypothetical protein
MGLSAFTRVSASLIKLISSLLITSICSQIDVTCALRGVEAII